MGKTGKTRTFFPVFHALSPLNPHQTARFFSPMWKSGKLLNSVYLSLIWKNYNGEKPFFLSVEFTI